MIAPKKFMLITLGEELLLGLTRNGHLTYIGDQLRQRGVTLHSNYTISDEGDDILDQFRFCWDRADIVITTGGLGPTVDDRTKEAVAEALGETLVFDKRVLETIEERFARFGKAMSANNRKQAFRPENAEVIPNDRGTAPGLWLNKGGKVLIMLPGPPNELEPMFENQVLPKLEALKYIEDQENYLQLRTIGVGESQLETDFQPLFDNYENLQIAYCAHQGQVDFRISYPGTENRMDQLLEIAEICKKQLGDQFLCLGHHSVSEVISNMLKARGKTLALAESCTGGLISNTFTDISGSSEFFLGGVVSYSIDSKQDLLDVPEGMIQQYTEVSQEVAVAMASGAAEKFESDYALSITGYAGPSGGTAENPVGTVYIGLHSPRDIWAKRFQWKASRASIKIRALNAALDLLRNELIAANSADDGANQDLRKEADNILKSLS
ncbi:MAG: competence/damage-inducible protein A [Opitutales bacterium]